MIGEPYADHLSGVDANGIEPHSYGLDREFWRPIGRSIPTNPWSICRFEHADYLAVRGHLPPAYQDVLDFAYYSGWRKREILELRWSEVDEPGGVVRTAWPEACRRAGVPGRLLHDCRRTAARNLVRAGVPERVAMQLTGHRSRAIFDRYYIVREDELHEAGAQLVAYVAAQADPPPLAWMDPVVSKNSNGPDGTRGREWRPARASPRSPPDGTERAHRATSSPRPAGADGR